MCDNDYAAPRDPFACQVSLPPLFSILHGRRELGYRELGYVDEMTFLGKQEGPHVLLLGRRA